MSMTLDKLPPHLRRYVGKPQPAYESAGQAAIGKMLDDYGIPFFYKQPTLVIDRGRRKVCHPDFTLPTYDSMVIEYHANGARTTTATRGDVYRRNDIAALFLDRSELASPDWQQRLYDRLEELYRQPFIERCRQRR